MSNRSGLQTVAGSNSGEEPGPGFGVSRSPLPSPRYAGWRGPRPHKRELGQTWARRNPAVVHQTASRLTIRHLRRRTKLMVTLAASAIRLKNSPSIVPRGRAAAGDLAKTCHLLPKWSCGIATTVLISPFRGSSVLRAWRRQYARHTYRTWIRSRSAPVRTADCRKSFLNIA